MTLIHAPAPNMAKEQPAWVRLVSEEEMGEEREDWPPADFRAKKGDFAQYRRPVEARDGQRDKLRAGLQMHPDVQPQGEEAVVANGEELHRYCRRQGILFLFYLGFNTNACVLMRDYGTLEMSRRGYEIAVLRDCTTGMESAETHHSLGQTRGAILFLEMFGKYSLTSNELLAGLRQ